MFTGIVQEVGEVAATESLAEGQLRLVIAAEDVLQRAQPGDSIAVNGVCLTVTELTDDTFATDVMHETLNRSSLGSIRPGTRVNLEAAATPTTALGGHIVQGHVDGTGVLRERRQSGDFDEWTIEIPPRLSRYLVEKGSVAVQGVSLTVAEIATDHFRVALIPTTLQHTVLGSASVGDVLNLEVDVLAKYVERLLAGQAADRETQEPGKATQ